MHNCDLVLSPAFRNDLNEIEEYIGDSSPAAARKVVRDIVSKVETLKIFPESGPVFKSVAILKMNLRFFSCGSYMILYSYEDEIISVLRVLHMKRNIAALVEDEEGETV